MICPHADTGGHELLFRVPAVLAHKRDNFFDDIMVIILMAPRSVGGMCPSVRPGFSVQAIDGKNLDLTCLDKCGKHTDHSKIFELMETASLRGKDQYRLAVIAIHFHFHVMPDAGTKPLVVFDLHNAPS